MDPTTIPLHDIHLPPPVGWWPPAPGWWALGLLLLATLTLGARMWRRRLTSREVSHTVMVAEIWRRWHDLKRALEDPGTMSRGAQDLSAFLRRVALTLNARGEVAGLTGEAWLRFLDGTLGGAEFTAGPGRVLASAPYRPGIGQQEHGDLDRCVQLCERWLQAAIAAASERR
jgi:hypothetical protein